MKEGIPTDLHKAICNNNLIVFVGAGLSSNLLNTQQQRLGGWSNFVKQMLLHLQNEGYNVQSLLPLVGEYAPIKVLDLIESNRTIPKERIGDFIKKFLDVDDGNDLTLHKKLYQLSTKIITTNYDTAFEKAVSELSKNKAYKKRNYELTKHKEAGAPLLFKLHGCFEAVDSMVLFPEDYNALYNNPNKDAEHSLLVLKNIIVNKSILFIGTGMGDFQINNLFTEIQRLRGDYNQKHFIITKTALDSSLKFLTPVYIKDYADIGGILDDLLATKEGCKKTEYEEITRLRTQQEETQKQLAELQGEIAKLKAEGSPYQQKLLQREALGHFDRGIQHHLSGALEVAIEEYERVTELDSTSYEAFYNWGIALADLAQTKHGEQVEELYLYNQACYKFQQATNIKPDDHDAFDNWGNTLVNLARIKRGRQADEFLQQACNKFQQAINIKPNNNQTLNNWGITLAAMAQTKQGKQADALFQQAFDKFQQATNIKPDDHDAFYNWGIALAAMAQTKQGKQADALFQQAFDKFQQATNIKPDDHEALNNWGLSLVMMAKTKEGTQAEKVYNQAISKYKQSIEYGGSSYNLARLYAIRGERALALQYLQHSLSHNEADWSYVIKDEDWKEYFDDPEFKALIGKFKK